MLLLLTIALVLVGAVALVIGFVGGDQLPIFISIACSLLAGGVLVVFSRMSRRQAGVPASAPAPLPDAPATRKQVAVSDDEVEEAVADEPAAVSGSEFSPDGAFPIEDYDELLVSEILPLLPELDPDELELVRGREESGKARATLLRRIEQIGEEEGGEPTVAAPAVGRRAAAEVEEEPAYDDGGEDELMFPIEDYDDLRVSEILPLLPELYDDELELVSEREREGANRASVLNRINELLGGAPAPVKAASKKVAAKKAAPARRAPAPAKKAAPARRAPAPAKKAATKKAAPAKKAVAKKAAPAKRTVAKKAAPAKKTTAKKTAARKR